MTTPGWVKSTTTSHAGQRVERVTLVDLGADLQVRRLGDGPDHLASHPSPRAEHADLGHGCLPLGLLIVDQLPPA